VLKRRLNGLSRRPWAPVHACTRPFAPGRRASGGCSTRSAAPARGQLGMATGLSGRAGSARTPSCGSQAPAVRAAGLHVWAAVLCLPCGRSMRRLRLHSPDMQGCGSHCPSPDSQRTASGESQCARRGRSPPAPAGQAGSLALRLPPLVDRPGAQGRTMASAGAQRQAGSRSSARFCTTLQTPEAQAARVRVGLPAPAACPRGPLAGHAGNELGAGCVRTCLAWMMRRFI